MSWGINNGEIVTDDPEAQAELQRLGVTTQDSSGNKTTPGIQVGPGLNHGNSTPTPSVRTTNSDQMNNASSLSNISGKFESMVKAAQNQYDLATLNGTQSLQQALQDALPEYQTKREQSAVNTAKNALSLKESLALMGDRGGMARQDILQNSTSGANELNAINLQEQKLKDDTAQKIADLISSNNLQAAIAVANLEAQKFDALTNQNNADRDYNYQKYNADREYNYRKAYDDRAFDYQKSSTDRAFDYQKMDDNRKYQLEAQNYLDQYNEFADSIQSYMDKNDKKSALKLIMESNYDSSIKDYLKKKFKLNS